MNMEFKTTHWNENKIILGQGDLDRDQPVSLIIGFHGAESTPENMLIHGTRLKVKNSVQIYPEGPIDARDGLRSWWKDGPKQKETVHEFISYSENLIESGIAWARENSLDPQIMLWGFSQGAAAALVYPLFGSQRILKAGTICGFLPELPDSQTTPPTTCQFLGVFGANDEVVPSFLAEFALDEIRSKGYPMQAKETPQAHEVTAENLHDLAEFFNAA